MIEKTEEGKMEQKLSYQNGQNKKETELHLPKNNEKETRIMKIQRSWFNFYFFSEYSMT
jgi:hypothetical protein